MVSFYNGVCRDVEWKMLLVISWGLGKHYPRNVTVTYVNGSYSRTLLGLAMGNYDLGTNRSR